MRAIAFAPLCALTAILPCAAQAQQTTIEDGLEDYPADAAIVVSAHRTPVSADRVGQSVTVLDAGQIARSQAVDMAELLARTPGVQFSRNGGRGATTSLYIRGAETGQSVVLIDGVRLNDPSTTDGGASLADVVTGDIGRIEVLRGAQSTLYGSQAIGGVINIVSRRPEAPIEAQLQAEAGGRDSYLARGALGGRSGDLSWRIGGGYATTDGVSAYAPGIEADGYENISAHASLGYRLGDNASIDLRGYYLSGDVDIDGYQTDSAERGESESWLGYAGLNFRLFGKLRNRIAYARTDIDRANFDETDPAAVFTTFDATGKTDRFEYQGTLSLAEGSFAVFGVERAENEMFTSSYGSTVAARDHTTGVYAQLTVEPLTGLTLTGGLRREDHSTFGGHTVGSASIAYSPNGGKTILRASWAEGFKAPSLYQLYSEYGNSALAPEEAASWDAGVEQHVTEALTLSAIYFARKSTNLIDFAYCTGTGDSALCDDGRFGYYDNVGRVETDGIELAASMAVDALTASINYTYLRARNATSGDFNEGNRLARRPQDSFNAEVSYLWPFGLTTGAAVRVAGNSFNDQGNTTRLKGYAVVDLRASLPINERVELYGRVENAFDEKYEVVADYGTLPRVFYAGARLRF